MSNPDLSRRVGRVIEIMMAAGLSIEERMSLAHRIESAEDFDSLPETDRRSILAAERMADAGLTLRQVMDLHRADLGLAKNSLSKEEDILKK